MCVCTCLMLHVGFYRSLRGDQAKLTERCVPSRENTEYVLNCFHLAPPILHIPTETQTASREAGCLSERCYMFCVCFQDECHNFIKVLVPRNDDLVFICGTNGFNPMCRYYRVSIRCQDLLLVRGCITISAFTGRHAIPESASSSAKHV